MRGLEKPRSPANVSPDGQALRRLVNNGKRAHDGVRVPDRCACGPAPRARMRYPRFRPARLHAARPAQRRTATRPGSSRLHDLRHARASHAVMKRESLHVVGRLLGHRRTSMRNRYVHLDDATLSHAAERVAMAIQRKLCGNSRPNAADQRAEWPE